ncbi:glycosyltransferase family 4 protein [Candidatus Thiothrix anitrata]|uniref:Glycosyltransferase family 4 protein n=1 Tax=Candidatus Thiothrix anitrata TaxID=2823902 RepID=A0ABX7X8Z5_9GAMM|nr:glycosyltransferase family 4 protein [Candidatus Thiothrix anitrata]QTR51694.1 glycosyltransferase family 4 protein [Candidatus Thiothrix anitrata]
MNILYIHGVGSFGGSSRSLYENIKIMKNYGVNPYIIVPVGSSCEVFKFISDNIITTTGLTQLDNTKYSHYKGLRWIVALREVLFLPFTIFCLLKAKARWKSIDIIHINEITLIIPALLAKIIFNKPIILHVRSLQNNNEKSIRTKFVNHHLKKFNNVLAIDENVRSTLPKADNILTVHNSYSISERKEDKRLQATLTNIKETKKHSLVVGFVGNLLQQKGIINLLEAANLVKDNQQIIFLILGGEPPKKPFYISAITKLLGIEQNVKERILSTIKENKLEEKFILLGHSYDTSSFYKEIDVICFPSELDAPGRPVFEAAFFGKPAIVTVKNPKADTIIHGETGLAIPNNKPETIANAIMYFLNNPNELDRMGINAKKLSSNTADPIKNSRKILDIYHKLLTNHI